MKLIVILLASLSVVSGCATSRGVVDLADPTEHASASSVDPAAPSVYIVNIEDHRVFEVKPPDPSIPSLKDGQITNREITSRAIARKRNGYGMALGDILLPEGKTVVDVVRSNLTAVLSENGYRVVQSPEDGAIPVEVSIVQFWSWFTPGFWAAKVEFKAELAFSGSLPGLGSGTVIEGYAHQRHQAATTGAWLQTMEVGLEDLRRNLSDAVQATGARSSVEGVPGG